ncbi:MAG: cyclophilin-like fold protein [Aigarchaeota archaeon]|nr:cyclophilin-like fold protein [Aigarchaeota archaeon]MCX8193128.1 cyclophilin-like fold protein [Nitrososphaeria archaeon]MDW7986751.1 cyclophilin-like fold protein [Nitrososphaerota archaeon]
MSKPSDQMMRIPLEISIEDIGILEGEFVRFYAPLTIKDLLKMIPLEGFLAKWDYAIYFQIDLKRGAEKIVSKVSGGDILFWPPGPYLLIAFKDATPPSQMVRVGRVGEKYGELARAKPGSRIRISFSSKIT